jgi:cardiolipin synthase
VDTSLALLQSVGTGLSPGNTVQLVQDARILEALEEEIRQARESLHLLASPWLEGEASARLLRAFAERQPGVACRILVDPLHSPRFFHEVAPQLTAAGCEVRAFRPFLGEVVTFDDSRLVARNHRQLAIRDGRSGLTGGSGVGPSWRDGHGSPHGWRDTYLRIEGPAVRELQQAFTEGWQEAGGGLLPGSAFPPLSPAGPARAAYVTSTGSPSLSHTERLTQVLIASARHRLWITNACFVPSTATADMLSLKARQGVDVRVLVPGHRDAASPSLRAAQRASYGLLLESGVRLWEYPPAPLRARTFLVDDGLVSVGSMNLEAHSHAQLDEGSLVVEDPSLARALAESFERDLAAAVEIHPEGWKERGLLERFSWKLPPSTDDCL